MKPPRFDYVRAESSDDAVACLREYGDESRILAGGQSLMAILNMRLAQPRALIDITRAPPLRYVRIEADQLVIGAAATQADVERRATLAREVPLLARAFPHIAHFQIRNRGTVCGSIAHADPSAELPLCLAVLDGTVVLRNAQRRRALRAAGFFTGMLSTARSADELLEEVHFPLAKPGQGFGFEEFAARHGDFAAAALAVVASERGLRVGVGGVADRPVVRDLPALAGAALDDALNELAWSLDARDDPQVSALARRHLVRTLGKRAVAQARASVAAARSAA
jgi:2-furoyl-CoA dehydrogenase FAD binding subunit